VNAEQIGVRVTEARRSHLPVRDQALVGEATRFAFNE
jgi:hypothetical protein